MTLCVNCSEPENQRFSCFFSVCCCLVLLPISKTSESRVPLSFSRAVLCSQVSYNFTSISQFVRLVRIRWSWDQIPSGEAHRLCLEEQCCRTRDWQDAGETALSVKIGMIFILVFSVRLWFRSCHRTGTVRYTSPKSGSEREWAYR